MTVSTATPPLGELEARAVEAGVDPGPLRLAGRGVDLRPVTPRDYEWLYALATQMETGYRWRFRGFLPSLELFIKSLDADSLIQMVACKSDTGEPFGHVLLYHVDFRNRHAKLAVNVAHGVVGSGRGIVVLLLFLRYVFATWDFRKLFLEAPEFNIRQFSSAIGRYLAVEGRLSEYSYYRGRYWDEVILSLSRETWMRDIAVRADRLLGS